jgi:hypothetical protein
MVKLDLGKVLKDGWDLMMKDIVPLLVGGLIAGLLGLITLGILAPVLTGGLVKMIVRRVRENRTAEIGDVFSCFDQFGTLFITGLVVGICTMLGFVLCFVPGLLLMTIWVYVFALVIDKKVGMGEAMGQSKQMVTANGFGNHLVILLVLMIIIGAANAISGGIAGILGTPFMLAVIMAMYFTLEGVALGGQPVPAAPYPQAPSAPPSGPSKFAAPPPAAPPQSQAASVASSVVVGLNQAGQEINKAVADATGPKPAAPAARPAAKLVCKSCGTDAPATGAFCISCGEPLKVKCSACSGELVPGAGFCTHCGAKMK